MDKFVVVSPSLCWDWRPEVKVQMSLLNKILSLILGTEAVRAMISCFITGAFHGSFPLCNCCYKVIWNWSGWSVSYGMQLTGHSTTVGVRSYKRVGEKLRSVSSDGLKNAQYKWKLCQSITNFLCSFLVVPLRSNSPIFSKPYYAFFFCKCTLVIFVQFTFTSLNSNFVINFNSFHSFHWCNNIVFVVT